MTEIEKLASILCRRELRKTIHTLPEFFAEVDRTWRRFIPESEEIVTDLREAGLDLVSTS